MTKEELSKLGYELASVLDELLPSYHVKSDDYTILAWESDILRAKSKVLVEGGSLMDTLKDSTLISKWGERVARKHENISNKVRLFHQSYNELMEK